MKWLRFFKRKKRVAHYRLIRVIDLPQDLANLTIYFIGEKGMEWLLALKCPCGCGATIQLNTLDQVYPKWIVTVSRRKLPTIYPSIHRQVGCLSHFCLKKGKVNWVNLG